MRRMSLVILMILFGALSSGCHRGEVTDSAGKRAMLRGRIVGRDIARNELTVDHEKAGDMMEAMTMPYPVQGVKVDKLPRDGTLINAVLHEKDGQYFLTDVRPAP
jgi:Cu/Ag efflux protein CusF